MYSIHSQLCEALCNLKQHMVSSYGSNVFHINVHNWAFQKISCHMVMNPTKMTSEFMNVSAIMRGMGLCFGMNATITISNKLETCN